MAQTLTIAEALAMQEAYRAAREAAYEAWMVTGDASHYARFAR